MEDITTQWQKPIYTKHLRESPAAYETFKILCHHPTWTLEKLSQETGRPQTTVKEWSSKYHYQSRLDAYLQHTHEQVEKQKIAIITSDLEAHIQRQPEDQALLDDDLYITRHLQRQLRQQLEQGTPLQRQEIQDYTTLKDSYHKANKDHTTTSQNLLRNAKEGIDPDRYDTSKMSPAARAFIEQLQQGREDKK